MSARAQCRRAALTGSLAQLIELLGRSRRLLGRRVNLDIKPRVGVPLGRDLETKVLGRREARNVKRSGLELLARGHRRGTERIVISMRCMCSNCDLENRSDALFAPRQKQPHVKDELTSIDGKIRHITQLRDELGIDLLANVIAASDDARLLKIANRNRRPSLLNGADNRIRNVRLTHVWRGVRLTLSLNFIE